jgi:flagellar protein FliT
MTVTTQPVRPLYEDMHALTAEMVEAARANRWNRVVELEHRVKAVRSALEATGVAPIPDADLQPISQLTRSIIDHITEVNRHAQPWLTAVRQFLSIPTLKERVDSTYDQ